MADLFHNLALGFGVAFSPINLMLCLIGAKLVGHDLPAPGGEIVLRARERAIAGRVAWADQDRRGMIFGSAREES